jgi:hypothetical protein
MGEASETNNKLVGIPDFPEKVDRLSKTRWRYDGLLE